VRDDQAPDASSARWPSPVAPPGREFDGLLRPTGFIRGALITLLRDQQVIGDDILRAILYATF